MSHNTLDTNVNVMKARTMLGMVSSTTCVDSHLLLEDDGFCDLLTKLAHSVSIDQGIEALTEYVNNNY
jgi:hypothetical protein